MCTISICVKHEKDGYLGYVLFARFSIFEGRQTQSPVSDGRMSYSILAPSG